MKRSGDLKLLWERASKKKKTGSTSTPEQSSAEVESGPQNQSNYSSDELLFVQNGSGTQPETGTSTEPEIESPITEDAELNDHDEADEADEAAYDLDLLSHDPGKRIPISSYDVNEQDSVRRGYIALGPCQPRKHNFPTREIGGMRRFVAAWFDEFDWLEYSVEKDAAFCFVCYLFKDQTTAGGDSFVNGGFRNWNMRRRLEKHVGEITSSHNSAQEKYNYFTQPKSSIQEVLATNTNDYKALYVARLTYSIKCLRFLLQQGLAFRGHDESNDSLNRGNFLELLKWLANNFREVDKVVLNNAPRKCKMIDPKIQKQLIGSCAKETTRLILADLDGDYFTILADESSDVRQIEQLALCIRYVDKKGRVVERFLGIVAVQDTTSLTLKKAIEDLLIHHSLSFFMVRGQGYDGASNMKGHVNGLKKLIMDESPSAYYVHCFAHQLQLTLVAVAKQCGDCGWFFQQLGYLLNVLGMSCKKIRMLRLAQADRIIEALHLGEIESGQGLNQEMGLARPCDTRWNSHYKTVLHVMAMYPSIRKVLVKIGEEYSGTEAIAAQTMLTSFESYEFVFMAKLMLAIFGITDDLSRSLQRRDQDIVNAMCLIEYTEQELENLRHDSGWRAFLAEVNSFCVKYRVKVVDMDAFYKPVGRSARFFKNVKNLHRFHVDMFLGVVDRQIREFKDRFDEVNTELLVCMASFNPTSSFSAYDKAKLVKLAHFYPQDFSMMELVRLPFQLTNFIADMRRDERFREVKNIVDLSIKLVETKKNLTYNLVYKLLKLVLVLPVATATVERVFSSMNYVKNKLRNKMGSQYLNDCLVTYLEKEFFFQVKDDAIISRFQALENRKVVL